MSGKNKHLQQIPMEDFFKNPEKSSFQLSPNGMMVAHLQPWVGGGRMMNVYVKSIGGGRAKRLTQASSRSIYGYFWINNQRIAYIQDTGGDENTHIYAVDVDGGNVLNLTPFDQVQARIIDDLEDDPDHMLIALNKRDKRVHDVYRLHVVTGKMKMVAKNPGNVSGWMTDNKGRLRVAVTSDGVNTSILYRQTERDSFQALLTTNFKETVSPLYFTFDDRALYVASNRGRDKTAIFAFDLSSAQETELIFEHDAVDVSQLMRSKKRKKLTGVSFVTDKRQTVFFDAWRQAIQEKLEQRWPGYEVGVMLSKDETKAIVVTYHDRSRGTYHYYDIKQDKITKLADLSPWLPVAALAPMEPICYQARDGMKIQGYLTLPLGRKHTGLPVVVHPHGGPWARDVWGFNPEVQYLANRGFAVLQMNFRGSTGYGRDFWQASFKQWGKTMQDDISDGVQWLIDKRIADPKRIAIYGASYGGYATLAGLTFTPDLYACGVDYVGVSNLFTFIETIPPYWELYRQMLYEMVGHPKDDQALLASASPALHVDRIKAPLFIAQGANDPRVKKSESDQMVKALQAKGVDVPYLVKEDEGHGFHNEVNRFDFYSKMTKFLEQYLQEV